MKLLAEHLAEDPAFVSRFQREAQAAARLVHPNIVQVFDSGLDERARPALHRDGVHRGPLLRGDPARQGWVEVNQAASIIEQACEGLYYAHRHGVVHRDVKPGNLLRSLEGEIKLADFGIAKATEQSSITQVGSVLGTAAYLAPEQARGEEAGPPADLYALGVVAYQLISGRLPYEATSLTELALKQQQEEPPLLDTLVAAAAPELAEAVAIALALDPRDRYRDAREMGRAVSDAQRGIPPMEPGAGETGRASGAPPRHATAATSLLAAGAAGASAGAAGAGATGRTRALTRGGNVAARQPRPGPPPRQAEPLAAASTGRGASRGRRLFMTIFALLLLVVVVVAVVIATAPATTKVTLREVSYHDVEETSAALQELVKQNIK